MENTRKFAVVTGASSGIGLELAKQFAKNGYDLLICSGSEKINGVIPELQALGASVQAVQSDLSEYEGVQKLASAITRPLDAIALNAGVGAGGAFVNQTVLDDELRLIDLNIVSTVHLAKLVLPKMVARGEGKVLFTASIAAQQPGTFHAVYNASKAFVLSFSEAVRNELKDSGVTVTALMPGATETDFFRRAHMLDTKVGAAEKDDPADVAKQGFEALMAGKDSVVAGSLKTKLQGVMGEILPETTKAELHRKQAEPGSARRH